MGKRNYLIIGGNTGIGLAVAESLREKGAAVMAASRSGDGRVEGDFTSIAFDALKDDADALPLPEQLHGLVYAPGTINLRPFTSLKDQDFLDDIQVNLMGAIRVIRAVLPRLKASGSGSIVLFSTVAARTGMAFHASIAAAKGAVEGLVLSLAAELAPTIRVNIVAPSLTDTPLAARLLGDEKRREASAGRHPLQRIGTAKDIAAAAVYLLSEESSWMTGQILAPDGGMSSVRLFR